MTPEEYISERYENVGTHSQETGGPETDPDKGKNMPEEGQKPENIGRGDHNPTRSSETMIEDEVKTR